MIDMEKFHHDGWLIADCPNLLPITFKIIGMFQYIADCPLEKIHEKYENDRDFRELHISFSEAFWKKKYSLELADVLLPIIRKFLGLDVMVQCNPYIRIARPHKPQDNIGYHKDTQYGQTPYELAAHIPFLDLDEKSAIRVISGSHLVQESAFERIAVDGIKIEKGSIENHMGRPYMPKCLKIPIGMKTTPLCMSHSKAGQYEFALFSPAIFHGQEVNEGGITRVSCDLRFVSAHHADKIRVGNVHAGYVPISESPVEKIADQYYKNNPEKTP